ncbi:pirin family protein [Thalassotalea hakodatensis]|uniref:pirin family protein n=1 Tax=Thalassotalea hakodatensis TaxID=3030492 RepID=UPI0025738963|nr:pirin family protein [Thalassotalea hakodatensis]
MIELRKANDRGRANFGWLDSKHSFSFGQYYDPKHMGFSALRVINDDIVQAGMGFDTHGHRDMEIISFVIEGALEHKDSVGNVERLPTGEFQLMSAGKGIFHSEYNASTNKASRFLQIWIEPNIFGERPSYQQKAFGNAQGLTTIVTPTGEAGTLKIKQDARLSQLILAENTEEAYQVPLARKVYVHLIAGVLSINGTELAPGDGAKVTNETILKLENRGDNSVTALVFELP